MRSKSLLRLLVCTTVVALVGAPFLADARRARAPPEIGTVQLSRLPDEAQRTVDLVLRGGPFLDRRDGVVFENRERRLPSRPRGYYLEYTVPTSGQRDRGPRRIVFGGARTNWDALRDALCDLSWLPESRGIVLVLDGAEGLRGKTPGELDMFIDV